MSTISSTASTQPTYAPPRAHSGKGRIASEINDELSAGTLSATDATALTTALDAIDTTLSADRGAGSTAGASDAAGSRTRLDPSEARARIDGLIDDQVSGGSLTSDQASTLKGLFAQQGGHQAASGSERGPGGAGGPPPGLPAGADAAAAGAATDATSASDLLAGFLQQVQASQASGSGYAPAGAGNRFSASPLLFDFQS